MRRLDGVIHVQLDTELQFARITFGEPMPIDFQAIDQAAVDAAYETVEVELTIPGEIVLARCEECGAQRPHLRAKGTGQLFELAGEGHRVGEHLELEAQVLDWEDGHPRLRLPSDEL